MSSSSRRTCTTRHSAPAADTATENEDRTKVLKSVAVQLSWVSALPLPRDLAVGNYQSGLASACCHDGCDGF